MNIADNKEVKIRLKMFNKHIFCLGLRSSPIQLRQYHRFLLMMILHRIVQYQWYIQINHF